MDVDSYQKGTVRTECDERKALERMCGFLRVDEKQADQLRTVRLFHAMTGIVTEVGEFATSLKKFVFYGKPLDEQNLVEELGDISYYMGLACEVLGVSWSDILAANNRKLKQRYPDKFSEERAADENRDLEAERMAMELADDLLRERESKRMEREEILLGVATGHTAVPLPPTQRYRPVLPLPRGQHDYPAPEPWPHHSHFWIKGYCKGCGLIYEDPRMVEPCPCAGPVPAGGR